jgi:ABC-2 type transport system ATP-binding protein
VPSTVLRVEGLTKRYGAFAAVTDVSFALRQGEVVAFLGQNGAGKSTVIKLLCNLVRPSAGQAWLDGEPILGTRGARHRRKLGAVVEAPSFYPQLSGRRNLELVARLRGVSSAEAARMLERVGLAERGDERFGRYSQGMKQRLGLAAAFLHRPRLVILDEPTGGLDPVGCAQIHALIRGLARPPGEPGAPGAPHRSAGDPARPAGSSILLCTHQLTEAAAICQRALVIERGRLILDANLAEAGGMAAVRGVFDSLAHPGGSEGTATA